MLCQKCKKNEATCHFRQVINGKVSERHLCAECAADAPEFNGGEFADMFNAPFESAFGLGGLLGHLLGPSDTGRQRGVRVCPFCGASENDIASNGRVGCAQCYDVFGDMLSPYIRRIHGNTEHTGRVPAGASAELAAKRKAEKLHAELQKAVEAQEFERAAELRDELKKLESDK